MRYPERVSLGRSPNHWKHAYPVDPEEPTGACSWRSAVWVLPLSAIQIRVGGSPLAQRQSEDGVEGRHRPEPPVEAKDVLVEVRLEVLRRDAVAGPEQPCVQVAECEVNHREMHICLGVVAPNGDGHVAVAERRQRGVSDPAVRPHLCAWRDVRLDERHQRFLFAVGHDLKPQTARHNTAPVPAA